MYLCKFQLHSKMEKNQKLMKEQEKNGTIIEMVKFESEIQLYRMRWVILAMFMVFAIASGVQWMQYTIIANFVMKFYQVEAYMVEWTSMFFMMSYVLLTFPGLWFLDKTVSIFIVLENAACRYYKMKTLKSKLLDGISFYNSTQLPIGNNIIFIIIC